MAKFHYQVRDKEGKLLKGVVEARNEKQAVRILRERELTTIFLKPETKGILLEVGKGFLGRIKSSELVKFTRQLATMVTAGLTLTDSLSILEAQSSPQMAAVAEAVLRDVEGGNSLADAMEKHPQAFDRIYVSLVRSGEAAGVLDKILTRLADNLEKKQEFVSRVRGAMIYPIIIVVGMGAVGALMIVFVIPRMMILYEEFGAELPITTKILMAVSKFITAYWWLTLILLIGGILALRMVIKTPVGRKYYDQILFRIPVLGRLRQVTILTEFTRTFGLLVGAGILVVEAIKILKDSTNSAIYEEALTAVSEEVEKGLPLATALARTEAFPPILPQMVAVGEETGKLDEIFGKISAYFGMEADATVRNLTTALEPLIMVILGIGVGFLIISIIMPIYNLISQF